jgi:hypothetical protein
MLASQSLFVVCVHVLSSQAKFDEVLKTDELVKRNTNEATHIVDPKSGGTMKASKRQLSDLDNLRLRDHILGAAGFLPGSGPIISFHLLSTILFSCIGFADHILRNSSSSFVHLCISESSQSSAASAV